MEWYDQIHPLVSAKIVDRTRLLGKGVINAWKVKENTEKLTEWILENRYQPELRGSSHT